LRQNNAPKRKGSHERKNPEEGFGICEGKVQFPLATRILVKRMKATILHSEEECEKVGFGIETSLHWSFRPKGRFGS